MSKSRLKDYPGTQNQKKTLKQEQQRQKKEIQSSKAAMRSMAGNPESGTAREISLLKGSFPSQLLAQRDYLYVKCSKVDFLF